MVIIQYSYNNNNNKQPKQYIHYSKYITKHIHTQSTKSKLHHFPIIQPTPIVTYTVTLKRKSNINRLYIDINDSVWHVTSWARSMSQPGHANSCAAVLVAILSLCSNCFHHFCPHFSFPCCNSYFMYIYVEMLVCMYLG